MSKKPKVNNFAFEVKVTINSDDDFKLSMPHTFTVTGPCMTVLAAKLLTSLREATVIHKGANSDRWYDLRDHAIEQVNAGCFDFEYGGNQTIQVELI